MSYHAAEVMKVREEMKATDLHVYQPLSSLDLKAAFIG